MASKEATPAAAAAAAPAEKKAERAAAPTFAFEFKLPKDKIGEKTTNKQVKSKVGETFIGWGAFDECRVQGDVGQDRTVYVFFARLFGKGQPAWDALQKGETPTINIYDETVNLSLSGERPSGGGATTGTATGPKKEGKKAEGKKPRGDRKEGGEAKDGKDSKESKDGKRPPRGPKKEEVKGPSLQRGRANIGGKLGPVSKIRLARLEKEKKEKEKAERIKAGTWVEEEKVVEEDPSVHIVKKGDAKKEAGKKEAGKKEAGKKEAGKAEAGKKDAGKKEAAKKGK